MTVAETATVAVSTLAQFAPVVLAGPVVTRGGRMLSARGALSIHDVVPGDGPWLVGVGNADLTTSELSEFLNLQGPLTPNDRIAVERSGRGSVVRTLGVMQPAGDGSTASHYLANQPLSGLRFSEAGEGAAGGWEWWIMNLGQDMQTGADYNVAVQSYVEFNPSG